MSIEEAVNDPTIPTFKTPQEKRRENLKHLVGPIVLESVAKDIAELDNVATVMGEEKAWSRVGMIIQKGVLAGLLFNDTKMVEAENKIIELENMLHIANKKLEGFES